MKTRLYAKIRSVFKSLGIFLKDSTLNKYELPESVTNSFFTLNDIQGQAYLVRINGKLWYPFTREHEAHNLVCLKTHGICTHVLHNDKEEGFQVCVLPDQRKRVSEMKDVSKIPHLLSEIGEGIKKFHQSRGFKNTYPVRCTISNTFKRLPKDTQEKFINHYQVIMQMATVLQADMKNRVSAHNDLLPSSVYWDKHGISFVDWEYSGENHRSYDLALFSIKSSLTTAQEQRLIRGYDPSNKFDSQYSIAIMKPVVSFLLLLWNITASCPRNGRIAIMLGDLTINMQNVIVQQTLRRHAVGVNLGFFTPIKRDRQNENYSKQKTIGQKLIGLCL